jgi:group I intron endonuclease
MGAIYQILNILNGHSYIGSAINFQRRIRQHKHLLRHNKHHSSYLQNAWNKYSEKFFEFKILTNIDNPLDLISKELYYFNLLKPVYNMSLIHPTRLGAKLTIEQRKRLSDAHKGIPNPNRGKKRNQPAWNKGKPVSPKVRQNLILFVKGKRASPKTEFKLGIINNPARVKKVLCVELKIVFNTIKEAGEFVGGKYRDINIGAACLGKQKSAYGYTWKFMV